MYLELLKYPIGRYKAVGIVSKDYINECIDVICDFPDKMAKVVQGLDAELDWKYRPEGWSIRQVVHHCADSHMNSFVRFKLAMTESIPTIKPYDEAAWAEMSDYTEVDISYSLDILRGLHHRWVKVLADMQSVDWERVLIHPEHGGQIKIGWMTGLYRWHCEHHLAHIQQAKESKGKFN